MTMIEISLPDEVARRARSAGLLSDESMLLLLEDALRRQAAPPSQTDWQRLRTMTDADIQHGIDTDPDSAPAESYEETKASYTPHPPRIKR